jgi:hypothetical protein
MDRAFRVSLLSILNISLALVAAKVPVFSLDKRLLPV